MAIHEKAHHLNQEELTVWLVSPEDLSDDARRHLRTCDDCRAMAKNLGAGFFALSGQARKSLPKPRTRMVLPPLEKPRSWFRVRSPLVFASVITAMLVLFMVFPLLQSPTSPPDMEKLLAEMDQDREFMAEVRRVEETLLPPAYDEIADTGPSLTKEFIDYIVPGTDLPDAGESMESPLFG